MAPCTFMDFDWRCFLESYNFKVILIIIFSVWTALYYKNVKVPWTLTLSELQTLPALVMSFHKSHVRLPWNLRSCISFSYWSGPIFLPKHCADRNGSIRLFMPCAVTRKDLSHLLHYNCLHEAWTSLSLRPASVLSLFSLCLLSCTTDDVVSSVSMCKTFNITR